MAKYFVEDASLTSVADAIRAKGGTSEALSFPDGFVSAVEGIQAGGGDPGELLRLRAMNASTDLVLDMQGNTQGVGAFSGWTNLKTAKIINTYCNGWTGESAFNGCSNLERVELVGRTDKESGMPYYGFRNCPKMKELVLRRFNGYDGTSYLSSQNFRLLAIERNSVPYLSAGTALDNTAFKTGGGVFLINASQVENCKTATNWSAVYAYGNRFLPLEDYTVDGTTSGEIDWDKVNALFEEA